ncbi:PQQ-dependent sugar dehydrogenase [Geodermatophilus sp. SYSU D00758]
MPVLSRAGARRPVAVSAVLAVLLSLLVVAGAGGAEAAVLPRGFTEAAAFSGLMQPTAVRFAPDGRVFAAEKRGTVQMYDGLDDATPTQVADLRTEVHNFWDRGLLGLAVDPAFPARPYLYVLYTFDGPVGGTAPRWGTPGADSDPCPDPPGATGAGCAVSGVLARLTLEDGSTTQQVLVHDWCQQYPSHGVGDLLVGADGALYVSAGDGASFDVVDHGQAGGNPCGDPPGAVGEVLSPPAAEGGALRSQDLRTPGDPVTLAGTVIRVSPDTGEALPDNPAAGAADPNARRIVAHGLRNPFRMDQRPGTGEIWLGDVGWRAVEEVNRIADPTAGVPNFGWPCYEGGERQPGYAAAGLPICADLYADEAAHAVPFLTYAHGAPVTPDEDCDPARGSSLSGAAFSFYEGGPYPSRYDGALFFSDYSRNCIWAVPPGADGLPDRSRATPFVTGAAGPVDLEISPAGELFYVDLVGGTVRRISHGAAGPVSCPAGQFLAEYFPGREPVGEPAVRACEAAPLDHDWGTGAPGGLAADDVSARWTGEFDFPAEGPWTFTATADDGIRVWVDGELLVDEWRDQPASVFTATRTLTAGTHEVRVEWYEGGEAALTRVGWSGGTVDAPPEPVIDEPAGAWAVGGTISFTGSATDPEDGVLPASDLTWEVVLQHCPDACHAHPLRTWTGVAGASIAAPDHGFPAHLELRLTATDSAGATTTVTRRLDPRTVELTVASDPPGVVLGLGGRTGQAPITAAVIQGSSNSLSAPSPQTFGDVTCVFGGWSDGGAQAHDVTADGTATHVATFVGTDGGPCTAVPLG